MLNSSDLNQGGCYQMRKIFLALVSVFFIFSFYACSGNSETIVAEYGGYSISMDEFKDAYNKNLSDAYETAIDTTKDMKNFLDLYVNYKMKLRDAEVRGFETDPEIQKEVDDYMNSVGIPYVQEKFVINQGLQDLYEKRKEERRTKHILIRAKGPNDKEAEAKAQGLLDRIKNGEKFEQIAVENSEDQFSRPDSGDIYWLTAGQTIAPFDNALFAAKAGEIYPEVVKTDFGFHIIKVDSAQPRKYQIKARHILAAFAVEGKQDSAGALEKITLVEQKLKDGEDFAELAKEYSDDPGSGQKGGELGYFSRRMMVEPFDSAVFNLGVGEISGIVTTKFGYHIIQVEDIKEYPSFEDEKENLKKIYEKNYFKYDSDRYLDTLKHEYNFVMNDTIYSRLKNEAGELLFESTYMTSDLAKEIGDSTLYTFNNTNHSVNDVISDINDSKMATNIKMSASNVERAVTDEISNQLYLQKAADLKENDSEFANLMEDYKKGLYIFKLQEEEVWDKLESDSTKLYEYYLENKDNYIWPDRASYSAISRKDSVTINEDYQDLQDGYEFETILSKSTRRPKTPIVELTGIEDNKVAAKAYELKEAGDISEPFKVDNNWYIVKLISKEQSRPKTYEEARSEVSSAWMEKQSKQLENEYLTKLKDLYHPKMYYDKLMEMDLSQTDK